MWATWIDTTRTAAGATIGTGAVDDIPEHERLDRAVMLHNVSERGRAVPLVIEPVANPARPYIAVPVEHPTRAVR